MRSFRHTLLACLVIFAFQKNYAQCDSYELQYPEGDICATAPILCAAQLDGLCANSGDYTGGLTTFPPPFCGTVENDAWIGFIASASTMVFQISAENCTNSTTSTGVQMVVYDITGCNDFQEMSNCWSDGEVLTGTVTATNMILGGIYYIFVDGWAGDACDYQITILQGGGASTSQPTLISSSAISCPTSTSDACELACAYSTVTYEATNIGDAEWEVQGAEQWKFLGNKLEVTWGGPGLGLITLTSLDTLCGSQSEICVEILETPVAEFKSIPPIENGFIKVCKGQPIFLENLSINAEQYAWDFGNTDASNFLHPEYIYQFPGLYDLSLIVQNGCFCSDTMSVKVQVSDSESPEIECIGSICPGETATYSTPADCGEFYWIVSPNGTTLDGGGTSDNFITIEWADGAGGTVELSVAGCSNNLCQLPVVEQIPLLVDNTPINGPAKVCKGETATYNIPEFDGTEFQWTVSPMGTIVEGQGTNQIKVEWDGSISNLNPQWVSVDFENCYLGCGGSGNKQVFILDEFFISGNIEFCENSIQNFQTNPALGTQQIPANWTLIAANGTTTWTSPSPTTEIELDWNFDFGRYRLIAEPANPDDVCSENYTLLLNVVEQPNLITGIDGETTICPGEYYTYRADAAATSDLNFQWEIINGFSTDTLSGDAINVQWGANPPYQVIVRAIITDGIPCVSQPFSMGVESILDVGFTITGPGNICRDGVGYYAADEFENVDYNWTIFPPDAGTIVSGAGENLVEIQWNKAGNAILQTVVCGEGYSYSVNINDYLEPEVIAPDGICGNSSANISTVGDYESWIWVAEGWVVGNGPIAQLPPGHYQVVVTDANGCTGSKNFHLPEFTEPEINISIGAYLGLCEDGPLSTISALQNVNGYIYEWRQDGQIVGGNTNTYSTNEPGFYQVIVQDENGCVAGSNELELLACEEVGGICNANGICVVPPIVNPGCEINGNPGFFSFQGGDCSQVNFVNTSWNHIPGSLNWNFGDPSSGSSNVSNLEEPSHTYSSPGVYTVILEVSFPSSNMPGTNCVARIYQDVEVRLKADFDVVTGCPGGETKFMDLSTYLPSTNITTWQWDFGDPASGGDNFSGASNPSHYYENPGIYGVTLQVVDETGCLSSHTIPVAILDAPIVNFFAPPAACMESPIQFFSGATGGNGLTYEWDFGDPLSGAANISRAEHPFHTFSLPGDYLVSLTVTDIRDCEATFAQLISVETNNLSGEITAIGPTTLCEGDITQLWTTTSTSYKWSTGGNQQTIFVQDAGIYSVTVTDAFGCTFSPDPIVIDVVPLPDDEIRVIEYDEFGQPINYFYDNYNMCEGSDIFIEALGNANYTYQWSTGQNGTQISYSNDHTTTLTSGTYTFQVMITDEESDCTNTVGPLNVIVHPVPADVHIASNPSTPVCAFQSISLFVTNPDPSFDYLWSTGETGESIEVFFAGKYSVTAINQFGCEGESNEVEVLPGPNTQNIPSGCYTRCSPDTICIPISPNILSYQWYHNGQPISGSAGTIPNYVALESGEYHVVMTDITGCVTVSNPLTLDLLPGFGTIYGNVYFDVNDNGQIDAADTLMTGIDIWLTLNGAVVNTSISGDDGYIFPNQVTNLYNIEIDTSTLPDNHQAYIISVEKELSGCDVFEEINFLIRDCPETFGELILEGCEGDTLFYNSIQIPVGESRVTKLFNAEGCDSVLTIIANPLPIYNLNEEYQACEGEEFEYNGQKLLPGTQTAFEYSTFHGCDSVVTVSIIELPSDTVDLNLSGCYGGMVIYEGTLIPVGESMEFITMSSLGCDSTVVVYAIELPEDVNDLEMYGCYGGAVDYNGTQIPVGTVEEFIFQNELGCDSTVIVSALELPEDVNDLSLFGCFGGTVDYNGSQIPVGTTQEFTFQNEIGCDSIVFVSAVEMPLDESDLEFFGCEDGTVEYNGMNLSVGSQTDVTLTNQLGCDSVVTVSVLPFVENITSENLEVCDGEMADYNGEFLPIGTNQPFLFIDQNGCDSTVIVTVDAFEKVEFDLISQPHCENGQAGNIEIINATGGQNPYEYSIDGSIFQEESIFENLPTGNQIIYLGDQNGCIYEQNIFVENIPPIEVVLEDEVFPCDAESVTLSPEFLSGITPDFSFSWDDGSSDLNLQISEPGIYTLTAQNECESIEFHSNVTLEIDKRPSHFYIPNAFSPNNDGVNDEFKPYAAPDVQVLDYELHVFDRWGNQMFLAENLDDGWNGKFRSRKMNGAVYVYWLKANIEACGRILEVFEKGDVVLME